METVGSLMERMRPKTMHAVTAAGFEWNVFLFVLAYSLNCLEVATWVNLMPFGEDPTSFSTTVVIRDPLRYHVMVSTIGKVLEQEEPWHFTTKLPCPWWTRRSPRCREGPPT